MVVSRGGDKRRWARGWGLGTGDWGLTLVKKSVITSPITADTVAMSNSSPIKSLWLDDIPVVFQERRKGAATRRSVWRGGRRDTDWTERPPDSWRHLQRRRLTGRWLSRLSIW